MCTCVRPATPWATPPPLQPSMPRVSQRGERAAQGQGLVRGTPQHPPHPRSKAGLSGETTSVGQWESLFSPAPWAPRGIAFLPAPSRLGGWAPTPGGRRSR